MNNVERLVAVLQDGQWHPSEELAIKVSWRFGHTVYEARKKNYQVQKRKVAHNRFEYRLLAR